MARVEISSMPWGTLWDRHGEGQNGATATLKNLDGTNATTWSAITGGTSSTASLTADASGNLPRFVEGGQYTLDVPALSITGRRVEAVSGSVESAIAPTLRVFGGDAVGRNTDTNAIAQGAPQFGPSFNPATIPGLDARFDASLIDGGVVASDTFARTDSATALGTADTGQAWTNINANVGISSGAAYLPAAVFSHATFDCGAADGVFEWTVKTPTSGGSNDTNVLCTLRAQDSTNYVWFQVRKGSASDFLQLTKKVANVDTSLGFVGSAGLQWDTYHRVKVIAKSNVYAVYLDGTLKGTFTDAGSSLVNQTKTGIAFNSTDVGTRVHSMAVSPATLVDGDAVAVWPDLALGLHAKQATVASRPIFKENILNGRPVVRFDGAAHTMLAGTPADQQTFTWVAVVSRDAAADQDTFIGSSASGGSSVRFATDGTVEILKTNSATIGSGTETAKTGTATIIAAVYESTGTYTVYVNGRAAGAGLSAQTFTASTTLQIGSRQGSAEWYDGDIASILRWNRPLHGHELRTVFDGLAEKWGVKIGPNYAPPSVLVAPDRRIRGANLHPTTTQLAYSGSTWAAVWSAQWDWTWVQRSIDRAYSAGANAFRAIGDLSGVAEGLASQATYLARQQQVIEYLAGKDMLYHASGGDLRHMRSASPGQIQTLLVAFADLCADYDNILCFEIVQELSSAYSGSDTTTRLPEGMVFGWIASWSNAIRAVAPALPLSVSDIGSYRSGLASERERAADRARLAKLDPYVDIFDVHLYPTTAGIYDVAPLIANSNKPVIIGEFGKTRASSTAGERQAFVDTIAALIEANPDVLGAHLWAAVNDNYGLYDETTDTLQTDIASNFQGLPTTW